MTSIKDVAEAAGVSTATVSRVLSDKPHVRPELRERVREAVKRLNYRPNLVARNLRSQQSDTIGLLVSDIRNPYFTDTSRTVEDVSYDNGYSVLLCNTDEDPEKEEIYLDLMHSKNVAGVIFSPTRQTAGRFSELDLTFPTVLIDRDAPDSEVDMVLIDNVDSGYRLAVHLIRNGYRRIAGIFGEMSTTGRQRRQGFETALREHNLTPPEGMARYIPPRIDAGHTTVLEYLQSDDPPDAVFTTNSLLTAGALLAIRECGLTIPDDVALVGFDETTWSTLVEPAITVIAQPTEEIGTLATELLLQRIASPDRPAREVTLKGKLLERGSSAPR